MRSIPFYKYQGTGNDFIMIDNREKKYFQKTPSEEIKNLCNRRFGIGADGLILLQDKPGFDFEMVYFNADGKEGTMCGNGARCIVAFANFLKIIESTSNFFAMDGSHIAKISSNGWVELKMNDVSKVEIGDSYFILNTGSPHYVTFVENLNGINVEDLGRAIRYSGRFKEEGINVNFVEKELENGLFVATYERGVEAETLSCGTGVTAAALSFSLKNSNSSSCEIPIRTKGGLLSVRFNKLDSNCFEDIWLSGPAKQVFKGEIYF